jgi:sugar phosphate permease
MPVFQSIFFWILICCKINAYARRSGLLAWRDLYCARFSNFTMKHVYIGRVWEF